MNWRTVALLYRHELLMLLRARRTVVMSLLLPAILMPIILLGSRYSQDQHTTRMEEATYRYAVKGSWAVRARTMIQQGHELDEFRDFKLVEVDAADPRFALQQDQLDFYIQTMTGPEADTTVTSKDRLQGVPAIRVVYRADRDISDQGAQRMSDVLAAARRDDAYDLLVQSGFAGSPEETLVVEDRNTATNEQLTGGTVGRFITLFLVMLLLTGGSVAAMDIIAGEKERGTLETLLTSAAGRGSIVTAKQLAICSVAFTITLIQAINFLIYVQLEIIELPSTFSLELSGASIVVLVALFTPLAAAIAAILLIISTYAKTYKEAQLHFFPAYILCIAPALASLLPGFKLRSAIALVPIANVSVAARDILSYRADPAMVVVAFASMTITAALLMRHSAKLLVREDIVIASSAEPSTFFRGEQLFRKHSIRWFAVMWAFVFVVAANIPVLQNFRAQVLFNQLAVFLGASLTMIAVYRLNACEALSIRAPRWPVWVAIPIAIPSAYMATVGLMKLANFVIPAPEELLRQFSNQVASTDVPVWQLYLLIALLPAICEEIAFRGVLLHGLRKQFSPAALCLVGGVVFGLFHYSLFRIAPTAFLGAVLVWITLTTGSVFPGMLLHAGNNGFALWLGLNEISLDAMLFWHYAAAALAFGLSLFIIYRSRHRELRM